MKSVLILGLLVLCLVNPSAVNAAYNSETLLPPTSGHYWWLEEIIEGPPTAPNGLTPDLTIPSNTWSSGGAAIVPGGTWTITFSSSPIRSFTNEHADSFNLLGPTNWTIASISNAPANNRGSGLLVGQAFQQPNTGGNTSSHAHAYWGFDSAGTPFDYVNAANITPPTRSSLDSTPGTGIYTAAASPGGPTVSFVTTFNVPSSWSTYLCPGALSPNEWIGLSGVSTDPNYLEATLYSSGNGSNATDASLIPVRPCRTPSVSVAKTGNVISTTGLPGGPGTMTVQYCFTVTNSSTNVHLANYVVTDTSIGYNSGTQVHALAPGANTSICAPNYTYNVTWPASGSACVANTSGASVTVTTPSGWREITEGNTSSGFNTGTYSASQNGANAGLQTCTVPLAVFLSDFYAVKNGGDIQVTWETTTEQSNRGFNLYRSTNAAAPEQQLNTALIPSQAQGSPSGFLYTWADSAGLVEGQTYWYWLEDVDVNGVTTLHGPVSVVYGSPTAVTLSDVQAHSTTTILLPLVLALAALALSIVCIARALQYRHPRL